MSLAVNDPVAVPSIDSPPPPPAQSMAVDPFDGKTKISPANCAILAHSFQVVALRAYPAEIPLVSKLKVRFPLPSSASVMRAHHLLNDLTRPMLCSAQWMIQCERYAPTHNWLQGSSGTRKLHFVQTQLWSKMMRNPTEVNDEDVMRFFFEWSEVSRTHVLCMRNTKNSRAHARSVCEQLRHGRQQRPYSPILTLHPSPTCRALAISTSPWSCRTTSAPSRSNSR